MLRRNDGNTVPVFLQQCVIVDKMNYNLWLETYNELLDIPEALKNNYEILGKKGQYILFVILTTKSLNRNWQ